MSIDYFREECKEDDRGSISFLDVLNVCGSVASLTGISLLWARGTLTTAQLTTTIPFTLISVAVFLACAAILFEISRLIFRRLRTIPDGFRWAYIFFAFAAVLYALYIIGFYLYQWVASKVPVI
jgi:hypothetical protein